MPADGLEEDKENGQELEEIPASDDTKCERVVSPRGVTFDIPTTKGSDKEDKKSPKSSVFIVPPPCGMADSVTPAKLSDVNLRNDAKEDILVLNRVSRFKNPHQIDRSKVDPTLEHQFIELLQKGSHDTAVDLLRTHVLTKELLLTTNALSTAIGVGDLGVLKTMILFPMVDFTTIARAPVCEAVLKQDVRMTKLLLLSPVTDVNKGSPVARAVEFGNYELVKVLLQSERINPNKGGALYRAIGNEEHYSIAKLLLSHKRVNVNKFCGGVGSTPLCRAVNLRAVPMLILLLSHPKIDINRGFLLTPLQHAVDTGCEQIVRLLISAETPTPLEPNKKLGASIPPLAMAVQSAVPCLGIVKLLLGISKLKIDPDAQQAIEARGLHEVEALVLESKRSFPLGALWRRRMVDSAINNILLTLAQLSSILWVVTLAKEKLWYQTGVMLVCLLFGHVFVWFLLVRKETSAEVRAAASPRFRIIPIAYDIWFCVSTILLVLSGGKPVLRSGMYDLLVYNNMLCQLVICVPQLLVQVTLLLVSSISHNDNGSFMLLMTSVVFNLTIAIKGFVGIFIRRREDQHREILEPCEKQQLRYTPQLLPIDPPSFAVVVETPVNNSTTVDNTTDDVSISIRRRQRPPGYVLILSC